MTFSPETQSILVLLALGLGLFALLAAVAARAPGRRGIGGTDPRLEARIKDQARALSKLWSAVQHLSHEDRRLAGQVGAAVQRLGLVRYDAFDDMGGRLSFSAAMLDAAGNGFVITSINGRSDTRCYAKAVAGGASEHNLSEEEAEAIGLAMAGSAAVPVAR